MKARHVWLATLVVFIAVNVRAFGPWAPPMMAIELALVTLAALFVIVLRNLCHRPHASAEPTPPA